MRCIWVMAADSEVTDAPWKKEIDSNDIGTTSMSYLNEILYGDDMQTVVGDITDLKFYETPSGVYAVATGEIGATALKRVCKGSNIALYIGAGVVGAGLGLAAGHFTPVGKIPGATIGLAGGLIGGYLLKNYMHGSMAGLNVEKMTYAGRR